MPVEWTGTAGTVADELNQIIVASQALEAQLAPAGVAMEEAKAEEAASHYRAVIESSLDAIISEDLSGRVMSWNPGAERLYGYSSSEAVGRSMADLVLAGRIDEVTRPSDGHYSEARNGHYESTSTRKDGKVVDVSLSTSPILDAAGVIVGASIIARDISDRKKAERLKDEFLALISHELRTPLSSIVAHVELLLEDDVVDQGVRRGFMEVVGRNSTRLERLVGDLLFVAQLESDNLSLSMVAVDIVAVTRESVEAMLPRARKSGVDVTVTAPKDDLSLVGDPGRLGQTVDNLLSNAIKYSPKGGAVDVRVFRCGDACAIEIEDHGIGIDSEDQGQLFDCFFRGSTAVGLHIQGVGLGLAIVKRIVEAHSGTVRVFSRLGAGTTFRVALPLDQSARRLCGPLTTTPPETKVA
jgi:PAS domain S-box-containing protein